MIGAMLDLLLTFEVVLKITIMAKSHPRRITGRLNWQAI